MAKTYLKRTFYDGDWYILKHITENTYRIIFIHGNFTHRIGDIVEKPRRIGDMWKHEWLTLEQVRLEIL